MTDVDASCLRQALGAFATGITVVTARGTNNRPIGMTVNSFTTVSLDPPLVLWSVGRDGNSADEFVAADHYAVHVLHAGQEDLCVQFARNTDEKFVGLETEPGLAGLPLLKDFTARFQCRVEQRLDGGDHIILLGRVLELEHRPAEPLIFCNGQLLRAERSLPSRGNID
ncbi:flavin reductase family protein [Methylonatrum kenyense]|uniref:flavin reductase family protein n=1 Tax=Methylonatrum kenyense TaxID=455253 RepID=UPI0020BE5A1F|nr:flavin reductase family protein [Methylonatrum kenyense]MCK8516946.1 flavin reductase family protein [Methylonatrum kenyense]